MKSKRIFTYDSTIIEQERGKGEWRRKPRFEAKISSRLQSFDTHSSKCQALAPNMPKRSRMRFFCRALTFIPQIFPVFRVWNAVFYFPFVVRSLRDEHATNRLEAERKHHSSCLSCATKAQRMSGRIFLFPLLSLASLLSLSYVFLGNSMFSLAFCTCPPLPTKEKEGWWASK